MPAKPSNGNLHNILTSLKLIFVAFLLTVIYFFNIDPKPTILSHGEKQLNIRKQKNIIRGEFTAVENYLGIIKIRFERNRPVGDYSIFRIKNAKNNVWYHRATIPASHYYDVPFYSFGFPVIKDSKGERFQFELELLSKNKSLEISRKQPALVTNYIYPKEVLLKDLRLLFNFVTKKIIFNLSDSQALLVFTIYSLPSAGYAIYFLILKDLLSPRLKDRLKQYIVDFDKNLVVITFYLIAFDIFVLRQYSDKLVAGLICLWVVALFTYRPNPRINFVLGFILILFCYFLSLGPMYWVAEKSAIWSYIMLMIGTANLFLYDNSRLGQLIYGNDILRKSVEKIRSQFIKFDDLTKLFFERFSETRSFVAKKLIDQLPKKIGDIPVFLVKLIIAFISLYLFVLIFNKVYLEVQAIRHKIARKSLNPVIYEIEPKYVYKGNKIVIYGKNLGWGDHSDASLIMDNEKINTSLWTDDLIYFDIPLHWSAGIHRLRIEKNIKWDGRKEKAKSGDEEFILLDVFKSTTDEHDLYYRQIPELREKTLELNGL